MNNWTAWVGVKFGTLTVNVARAIGERLKEVEEHGTSRKAYQGC